MTINIGGKDREFGLDFLSFAIAEEKHRTRVKYSDLTDFAPSDFLKFLWIGLLISDHSLTKDKVHAWAEAASSEERNAWSKVVWRSIEALGKLTEADEKKPSRQSGLSTGDISSLSPTGS